MHGVEGPCRPAAATNNQKSTDHEANKGDLSSMGLSRQAMPACLGSNFDMRLAAAVVLPWHMALYTILGHSCPSVYAGRETGPSSLNRRQAPKCRIGFSCTLSIKQPEYSLFPHDIKPFVWPCRETSRCLANLFLPIPMLCVKIAMTGIP
jgi:hypothetical protein